MDTLDLCKKFDIPIPPSVWEKHGLEVPEFQRVGSGRIVPTIPENMRAAAAVDEQEVDFLGLEREWKLSIGQPVITHNKPAEVTEEKPNELLELQREYNDAIGNTR